MIATSIDNGRPAEERCQWYHCGAKIVFDSTDAKFSSKKTADIRNHLYGWELSKKEQAKAGELDVTAVDDVTEDDNASVSSTDTLANNTSVASSQPAGRTTRHKAMINRQYDEALQTIFMAMQSKDLRKDKIYFTLYLPPDKRLIKFKRPGMTPYNRQTEEFQPTTLALRAGRRIHYLIGSAPPKRAGGRVSPHPH